MANSKGLTMEAGQDVSLEVAQGHELAQHLGWVSDFLESVLPISESLLRTRRARVLLDAWTQAAIADEYEGVLDLALAINEPHVRPWMVRFYSDRTKRLADLVAGTDLLQLDQRLRKKLENQVRASELIREHATKTSADVHELFRRYLGELGIPTLTEVPIPVDQSSDQLIVEPSGETLRMRDLGLIVERRISEELMTWRAAHAYVKLASPDGVRWRLPTARELELLARTPGAGLQLSQRDYCWSSEAGERKGEALAVHLGRVERWTCPMNWTLRVWRVRLQ